MKHVIIAGAGAIGNYLGIQLYKAGVRITFLGSSRIATAVKRNGLIFEYPDDRFERYIAGQLAFTSEASCVADADLVIVTVKSLVTETLIAQIRPHLSSATTLLTLQNGISNAATLKQAFPKNTVLAGMVTFNVIEKIWGAAEHSLNTVIPAHAGIQKSVNTLDPRFRGDDKTEMNAPIFRLTTHGEIYLEKHTPSLLPLFEQARCAAKELDNIDGMLWSKLLLNLINPLNALSGKPLKENLQDHTFRLQWAACMREGLAVLKAAGIKPSKVTPLPPHLLPFMVSLPNWIYLFLAKNMTDMDPTAKSSMAQDMEKGKPTEIDYLSGEIIRLGKKVGVPTPENEKVYQQIKH